MGRYLDYLYRFMPFLRKGRSAVSHTPVTSIPIVKEVPQTLGKTLSEAGVTATRGREARRAIGALPSDVRKTIATSAKNDIREVESEIARLRGINSRALGPDEYMSLQNRMKELQGLRRSMQKELPNIDRTLGGRIGRGAGLAATLGFAGLDAAYFGPKIYDEVKDGRYGNAALTAGEALLFNALPLSSYSVCAERFFISRRMRS